MRTIIFLLILFCFGINKFSFALDINYPNKPLKIIVPFPIGGATDILSRLTAQFMSSHLERQIIIDNKSAASGILGAEIVANAKPDGYTILHGSSSTLAINRVTFKSLSYDPIKSFKPIAMFGAMPWLLIIKPSSSIYNLKDLIATSKKSSSSYFYASSSSSAQLATEYINYVTGMRMLPIPYKGTGDANRDFLSGQIDVMVNPIATSYPLVLSGKAKAIAVTSDKRSLLASEIPTLSEQGLFGLDISVWHCLVLPANTDNAIVSLLDQTILKVIQNNEYKEKVTQLGIEIKYQSSTKLSQHIQSEIMHWQSVADKSQIKFEY